MVRDEHRFRYPWRSGNRIQVLIDGKCFFPAMLQAIAQARSHVLLEIYLFESGEVAERFINALSHASLRGVQVALLLDDYGARQLQVRDRRRLREAGVQLCFYNPLHFGKWRRNLFRDHRKLLVVDGALAFIGGAGITDEFDSLGRPLGWHEVMARVRGPIVADFETLFLDTWQRQGDQPLTLPRPAYLGPGTWQRARLSINAPSRMEIKRSLLKQLSRAEQRIWIATAYFIPSWKIRRRLRRAAMHGVDVRLLLPGRHTDHPAVRHAGRRFYAYLLRNGVRIFEYQPRFLHAKVMLCDDWVSIGSSNIDRWNLRWNLEANLEAEDRELAEQVSELFREDFADSREMHYPQWRQRPWYRRLQENFWGSIDRLLERFGQGRQ